MAGVNVADDELVVGDHVTGEVDFRFGRFVEEREVGDRGASQHFVEKRQVVVAAGHDADGRGSRDADDLLHLGNQLGLDIRVMKEPSDHPIQEGARCVSA